MTEDPGGVDLLAFTNAPDRHGLPGVQIKASATLLTTPVATTSSRGILKINPVDYPHLVANERVHLEAARALRIPIANASEVHDKNGVPGLLVERVDRIVSAVSDVRRLGLEDAAQVMGVYPARKYSDSSEQVVSALSEVTHAPLISRRNLFLQFVFAWLTGNGDLHAKNLSVLRAPGGAWSVAPVYDIPSTVLFGEMSIALPIDGRTKNLQRRHWEAFAVNIGLPRRAAASAMRRAAKTASMIDLATLRISGPALLGAQRELRHRRYELEDI